ncbi:MAG: methyl-accepting chemotaxis protein [Pirellulales bacterium]
MTNEFQRSFWRDLRVGRKLATIPALFILGIAAILLYTLSTMQDQQSDSLVVDMAGRQRMLNQRQLTQLVLATRQFATDQEQSLSLLKGTAAEITRNMDYEATRQVLNDSLESLLNGGPIKNLLTGEVLQVPPAPTSEIRDSLVEQKQALEAFAAKGDEFLKLKEDNPRFIVVLKELLDLNYRVEVQSNESVKLLSAHSRSKIAAMMQWETVIGVLVAVLGSVFSWLIARGVITPLASVVSVAQRISQGDLRVQKVTNVSGDEVGQLAAVFNQMLDTLKDLTGQTVSVTGNLNAAAAEILASTQQQAAGTKQQAATVQEITATMEEVRQSGSQISEKAQQVASAAELTSTTSSSGLRAVQETNGTMEAIREQVEEVAENIVSLSEKTQAVGEIIATVNDIAERSNLLALNAAIEAAAAGDQGNRFSVVANEIKNLADQAKDSTVQVRNILGEIQKGINSSVMLTEEAVKRVEAGKQQADVAEQTIRQMTETTVESVQTFQQIIGATSQQQIGFEQVTQGMQDIRQAASQTAASTLQLERAVASLNAQSQQLRAAVGRYQL